MFGNKLCSHFRLSRSRPGHFSPLRCVFTCPCSRHSFRTHGCRGYKRQNCVDLTTLCESCRLRDQWFWCVWSRATGRCEVTARAHFKVCLMCVFSVLKCLVCDLKCVFVVPSWCFLCCRVAIVSQEASKFDSRPYEWLNLPQEHQDVLCEV